MEHNGFSCNCLKHPLAICWRRYRNKICGACGACADYIQNNMGTNSRHFREKQISIIILLAYQ